MTTHRRSACWHTTAAIIAAAARLADSRLARTPFFEAPTLKLRATALDGTAPTSAVADQLLALGFPGHRLLHTKMQTPCRQQRARVDHVWQFTHRANRPECMHYMSYVRMQVLMGLHRQTPEHGVVQRWRRHAIGPSAQRT